MRPILVLDPHTIDQIAAGEVVERPASVVKELVENAIDAGATAVTVEIAQGGKSLVRITDNGSGIAGDQVPTAFLSHATSKIERVEDLETVTSLGFRGEALSSIAAVAKVELITKQPSSISGTRYVIEGGKEQTLEETGAPDGTTFLVRDLFYNTPARKKFLKSDTAEAAEISALIEQLALSHPEISFKFMANGLIRLHTSGTGRVKDVIYSVYGKELTKSLLEISFENEYMAISGFAGKPEISRGNRTFENYYVNGRYVRNNLIAKGIEDGYKGFLMQHRFPFVLLNIRMDPELVDVNVHPRKLEIRFSGAQEVYESVLTAVRSALTRRELIPNAPAGREERRPQAVRDTLPRDALPEPFERRRIQTTQSPDSVFAAGPQNLQAETVTVPRVQEDLADYPQPVPAGSLNSQEEALFEGTLGDKEASAAAVGSAQEPAPDVRQPAGEKTVEEIRCPAKEEPGADVRQPAGKEPAAQIRHPVGEEPAAQIRQPAGEEPAVDVRHPAAEEPASEAMDSQTGNAPAAEESPDPQEQMELFDEKFLDPRSRQKHRLIGQVFQTYWLVEFKDSLFIIDQHAAHEKIYYERFTAMFRNAQASSQMLLPPRILTLTMQEEEKLLGDMGLFEKAGFEIEHYGGREYCIRAVPSQLYGFGEEEMFRQLLDLPQIRKDEDGFSVFAQRLASMACKAAVKGGNLLSEQEADAMIDELLGLEEPYHCPHGRPTIIEMTRADMEKKFHRTV